MSQPSEPIIGFSGSYRWLSPFHPAKVRLWGLVFTCSESAYQAAKLPAEYRHELAGLGGLDAKEAARRLIERGVFEPGWKERRLGNALITSGAKFDQNPELAARLIATLERRIVADNWWGDTYLGVCEGRGENHLGKTLMIVRTRITHERKVALFPLPEESGAALFPLHPNL